MKTTMRYHPTPVRMAVYHQNEKKKQASVRRWNIVDFRAVKETILYDTLNGEYISL